MRKPLSVPFLLLPLLTGNPRAQTTAARLSGRVTVPSAAVRAEAFSAFNHQNFGDPAFGVISSASGARIVPLALKYYFQGSAR